MSIAFDQYLAFEIKRATKAPPALSGHCKSPKGVRCELCYASRSDYASEQIAKRQALVSWSAQQRELVGQPEWIPSPLGRNYRTTSKRRWLGREQRLVMTEEVRAGRAKGILVEACYLEPPAHGRIYQHIQRELAHTGLGGVLNYAILKGTLEQHYLLLNLPDFHARRAEVNRLSKSLTQRNPELVGVWVVKGAPQDDYYLNPPPGAWQRIYGPKSIVASSGLHYSPLCFSQINETLVPQLLDIVHEWLGSELPLLDLYCGYGLLSLARERSGPVAGVELSRESVEWARQNARHRKRKGYYTFGDIEQMDLGEVRKRLPGGDFVAVLDPPRGGAGAATIAQVAELEPSRVVHLVCAVDKTFEQAQLWRDAGYRVERTLALDMFPGTPNLEMVLLLSPVS